MLPTVAGTPQAQAAVIENSIPQTATVPLKNGPQFTPSFDGPPQWAPVPGTALTYVANSSVPIIQVAPGSLYAVAAGVWFTAAQVTGPWAVATSVPAVVYTIPASSPIHYVTYVRIYEATPQYVYVGYTPGYLGTVVTPEGTVVYGTGYAYSPWVGTVWYAPPYTYGIAAVPVYNPYVGFSYGFALGLATAAWAEPWWGGAYYYPAYWGGYHGYPCCASASANVYGHWGNTTYSGTRTWYAGGGVAGTTFSGTYDNARTGTTGDINAGTAVQRLHRQRHARLRPHDERRGRRLGQRRAGLQLQRLHRPALDRLGRLGHDRRRQHLRPRGGDDRGARGQRPHRRRHEHQREDRPDQYLGHGELQQQPLRRRQRQRLQEHRRRLAEGGRRQREQRLVGRLGRHVVGRQGVAGAQRGRRPRRQLQLQRRRARRLRLGRPLGRRGRSGGASAAAASAAATAGAAAAASAAATAWAAAAAGAGASAAWAAASAAAGSAGADVARAA